MVFERVQAITLGAFGTMGSTGKGGMAPLPAVATLRNVWIHVSASDSGNVKSKVERAVDKHLGFGTIL